MDKFYKDIADADDVLTAANADTQLTLAEAFTALAALGAPSTHRAQKTYADVADEAGAGVASQLQTRVQATQPDWVDAALSNGGIDVNNHQVSALLNAMVDAAFTQVMADAVVAMGVTFTKTFPALKMGHLQNAREQRALETV